MEDKVQVTVESACANSQKPIKIKIDDSMRFQVTDKTSNPLIFLPIKDIKVFAKGIRNQY